MNPKIEKLIKQFAKLPRIGGRAAQRIVLSLLQDKTGRAAALAKALNETASSIKPCSICGCLTDTTNNNMCEFCKDNSRANSQLCIVRDLGDIWTLEKSGIFRGRYHVIGGLLSGLNGMTPADLNILNLPERIKNEKITEVIFALPNTVEGKTTQHYIITIIGNSVMFSELASGVPLGGDLDYIDDGTLSIAFDSRKQI